MAKTKQTFRARVTQAAGRGKKPAKKPTNPVQRAFDDVKQLVSDTGGRVFSKKEGGTKQTSSKKTAVARKRSGQQKQAATKKSSAAKIKRGQQRQAATKKAARARGLKTS